MSKKISSSSSSSTSRRPHPPPRLAAATESGGADSPSSSSSSPSSSTNPHTSSSSPSQAGPYSKSLRLMWASQFISILGTEVSKFALRTWSYEASGAVTDFAWVIFLSELPAVLLSPLTGPVVDRSNRKLLMLAADLTAGVATLVLCLLWRQGAMSLHHIYFAVTLQAVCNSVQLPAFMASLSLLLAGREQELVKLNSVSQALSGVAMLLAPTISSTLLKTQGSLAWVFAFDLSTLLLAVLVMLATRIPSPPAHQHPQYQGLLAAERQHSAGSTSSTGSWGSGGGDSGKPTAVATATYSPSQQQQQQQQLAQSAGAIVRKLWRDTVEAWRFLRAHGGLYALLLVVAQIQLSNGAFQILSTPIILSFAEPAAIAGVLTVSGVGAMLGFALPIALKGANAHRARTVLACVLAQGLLLLLLVVPRLPVVLGVAFGYMLLVPLSRSCREALWMQKVPVDMQGRVFSLQHSIAKAALPVAAVLAGPLVDRLLQPLVDSVPALAALCGAAPNDGAPGGARGRGSALLALLLGAANVGCAAAAFAYPPYRALDETPPAGEAWQHRE